MRKTTTLHYADISAKITRRTDSDVVTLEIIDGGFGEGSQAAWRAMRVNKGRLLSIRETIDACLNEWTE